MRTVLVLDTGAFIAAERWNRTVLELLDAAADEGVDVVVPASVVAEAWRHPPRPNSALLLDAGSVIALDRAGAQRVGVLLGRARSSQVVDGNAAAVAIELRPSLVLTADPDDLTALVNAAGYSSAIVLPGGEPGTKRVDVLVQAV